MRASQFLIATLKQTPSDAVAISHQLMLRAGLIRQLASGLYNWLPLGLRVLRKVETIIRQEMDAAGAQEVLMPVVQPAELWQESMRWEQYGPELLRFNDRHDNPFCLGPTHEEVITDLIRGELRSYKQLPANFYQIQTKFRDEVRPRFGVMRAREFTMKDAYSFHLSQQCLQRTYDVMYETYNNIFARIGLDFRPVIADTGSIGGSSSHEFHVLAESGEDAIAFSTDSPYAANVELAEATAPRSAPAMPTQELSEVATPGQHTIEEVSRCLQIPPSSLLKTLIVMGEADENGYQGLVALVVRGDHELNELKAEKLPQVATPLCFAEDQVIRATLGCGVGSLGPVNLQIPVLVDRSAAVEADFACGANRDGFHFIGVNWNRDLTATGIVDIRKVVSGDASPCGSGTLEIKRGIEVGHIFQLGSKYSAAMRATVLDENGAEQVMTMGCYGIGVSRVVAAAIEQNYDTNGIIWPQAIAPFQLALVPINMHKSAVVREYCESAYRQITAAGVDVLFMDEDKARLGVMLADTDLMGIPHRIVVGERGLEAGVVEYKARSADEKRDVSCEALLDFITDTLK